VFYNPAQTLSATLPTHYNLTLVWNPSPSPGVIGGNLYYGTVSGNYTNVIPVGNVTTATILGLSSGVIYYFAITAVDTAGEESDFSNEISYERALAGSLMQVHLVAGGQLKLTVTGLTGHTFDIEVTEDFTTWTVIGTVTLGTGSSAEFTDTNAPNYSQRFYRTRDLQP